MCSPAPDTSGMNAAAKANAEIAKQALDWYMQQYAENKPQMLAAQKTANDVSQAQLAAMKQNYALAADYDKYNKTTFRPLEISMVKTAQDMGSQGRQDANAGRATGDVQQQFSAAADQSARALARSGVDPNSGRALAVGNANGLAQAAAMAGASNNARLQTQQNALAVQGNVAGMGRNLANNQATSAGIGINAGNAATTNAGIPLAQATQMAGMVGSGFNTAISGNSSAGSIYGQQASIQNTANANENALLKSAMESGAKIATTPSDKHLKTGRAPVDGDAALRAVADTPVESWQYKPGAVAADGRNADDGGQTHIGPMAQEVQRRMGDEVAPGGKMIDLISMNGVMVAAVAALNKKVDKLAARVARPRPR